MLDGKDEKEQSPDPLHGVDPAVRARLSGSVIKPPASYGHKVAEALRQDIVRGLFRPGERLPTESELCTLFGVSRAVIREAVSALRHEGFVISYQGRGLFVADRVDPVTFKLDDANLDDQDDLKNVLDFLIANEVAATELAAVNRTEEDLASIRSALESMTEAADQGEDGIDDDLRFHMLIIRASRNPYFISFTAFLENRVRHLIRTARANSEDRGWTPLVHHEHVEIFNALQRKDREGARIAAETHLRNAAERLRRRLSPRG